MKISACWWKGLLAGAVLWLTLPVSQAQEPRSILRLGLSDAEFVATLGSRETGLTAWSPGYVGGYSTTYNGTTETGQGAWVASLATGTTARIGLYGAGYTSDAGLQYSAASVIAGGYVSGGSFRYSSAYFLGNAIWITSLQTGATTRLGYFDSGYTRTDGYQVSTQVNHAGNYVTGFSVRYSGSTDLGRASWAYDTATGTTTRLGFTDAGHTRADGYQSTTVQWISGDAAVGSSSRYSGSTAIGRAIWVANMQTGTPTRIGLFAAANTATNGTQSSDIKAVADGYAAGSSNAYSGNTVFGQTAWAANLATGTTNKVGLYDASYTHSNGGQYNAVDFVGGGYVAGNASRYNGAASNGNAVWLANAATGQTVRIGFSGAENTSSDGSQSSVVTHLTGGVAAGYSAKYGGAAQLGQAAWLANGATGTTRRVGLFDASHTSSDGTQVSTVRRLSGSYAVGESTRFEDSAIRGQSTWVAGAISGDATRIGLYGVGYTRNDDRQVSSVSSLAGNFVAGYSTRYAPGGSAELGQTAWVFNLQTQAMDAITLSLRPSDGASSSTVTVLFDSGLAIGEYTYYDAAIPWGTTKLFGYTPQDGAFDLASVVAGGISSAGWAALGSVYYVDPMTGAIVGLGTALDSNTDAAVYALVPEPSWTGLFAMGALSLLQYRCRRRAIAT